VHDRVARSSDPHATAFAVATTYRHAVAVLFAAPSGGLTIPDATPVWAVQLLGNFSDTAVMGSFNHPITGHSIELILNAKTYVVMQAQEGGPVRDLSKLGTVVMLS
jgi:hypothetical protein